MAVSNVIRDSGEGLLEMPTLFGRHLTEDISFQEIPTWKGLPIPAAQLSGKYLAKILFIMI